MRVTAERSTAVSGASVPLHAVVETETGADTAVRWSADSSDIGWVTRRGVAQGCFRGGVLAVTATSVADSTKSATVSVRFAPPSEGWAAFIGPLRVGLESRPLADQLAPADSLVGDVDLLFGFTPVSRSPCHAVERLEVRLVGPGVDRLLEQVRFWPAFTTPRHVRVRLRSRDIPNGAYAVRGIVYVANVAGPAATVSGRITIRNP